MLQVSLRALPSPKSHLWKSYGIEASRGDGLELREWSSDLAGSQALEGFSTDP